MEQHNTSIKDNWVDQLATHGLFDLSVTEGKRLRDMRSGKQQPQAPSLFNKSNFFTSTSTEPTISLRRTQLLALRGNDLFLAVGSTIRVLNLTEFKDAWVAMTERLFDSDLTETDVLALLNRPHKLLETPGIDFDIDVIIPNRKGSLLAVAGEQRIAVVCLPRKGFSSQSDSSIAVVSHQKVSCKTLLIGDDFYTNKSRVLQLAWHPLSETGAHLMVLSNDSVLCMFDVGTNIDHPEQIFDLAATQRKPTSAPGRPSGIHADDEMEEIEQVASFDLGGISRDTSKWEPFTVYYALNNGHIYALCPVLPYKSTVRRQHLESLACVARAKCNDLMDITDPNELNPYYYYFALQYEWIKDMLESAKSTTTASHVLADNNQLCIQSDKTSIPLHAQPQGPFVVKQSSQRKPSIVDSQVSDMLLLYSRGLSFITLAFTNGTIENYQLAGGIGAQWTSPSGKASRHQWQKELSLLQSSAAFLPRASLYETIDFEKPQLNNTPIWLNKDPIYDDTYYAYHAGGVHSISTTRVLDHLLVMKDKMGSSLGTSNQAMASFNEKQVTSDLRCLINSSPFESGSIDPILGMVVVSDTYLSYCLLSLDANYRMIGIDMYLRNALTRSAMPDTLLGDSKETSDTSSSTKYQVLLSQLPFDTPNTLQRLINESSVSKVVIPPEFGGTKEVIITKETLNFLAKTATALRKDINEINKCASQLSNRLMLQREEYKRQIETLLGLYDRASSFEEAEHESLEAAQRKHTQIALRIDHMLKNISNAKQLGLSHKEQEWVDKINTMATEVTDYSKRVGQLEQQIKSYRSVKPTPIKESSLKTPLSVSQASFIRDTLNIQKPALDDIKQRMEMLKVDDI